MNTNRKELPTWSAMKTIASNDNVPEVPTSLFRCRLLGRVELPDGLAADLGKLDELEFNVDYSEYASGHWASLALFNREGDAGSSAACEYDGAGKWTANAEALPTIQNLIGTVFKLEAMRTARIFVAQGGGLIRPHRDYLEFKAGFTRLHLVIQTNPLAMNGEGHRAYHMAPGTVWFLDGQVMHWAANFSEEARYHVVVDFPASMSPEECLREPLAPTEVSWVKREPISAEIVALLQVAAAQPEAVASLLDIADRLYVRYDCGQQTPYDLVLPYLGGRAACVERTIKRRVYFLGM